MFLTTTSDTVIVLLLHIFILTYRPLQRSDCSLQYFLQPADAINGRSTTECTSMAIWTSTRGTVSVYQAPVMVHNADDKREAAYLSGLRGCKQGAGSPWG